MFDPVLHMSQHLEVKGEPARESQSLSFVMTRDHAAEESVQMRARPSADDVGEPFKEAHAARNLGR